MRTPETVEAHRVAREAWEQHIQSCSRDHDAETCAERKEFFRKYMEALAELWKAEASGT